MMVNKWQAKHMTSRVPFDMHNITQYTRVVLQHARSSCMAFYPSVLQLNEHHQCFVRCYDARYGKDKSAMQRQASRFGDKRRKTENACSPMTSSSHAKPWHVSRQFKNISLKLSFEETPPFKSSVLFSLLQKFLSVAKSIRKV